MLLGGEQALVVSTLLGTATAAAAARSARYVGLALSHGGGAAGQVLARPRSRHGRGATAAGTMRWRREGDVTACRMRQLW